jgi:predicted CoA-substrate-specific enzyme activase
MGTKVVLFDGALADRLLVPTGWNPREAGERALRAILARNGLELSDVLPPVLTGYGRNSLKERGRAVTEITCHARGVNSLLPAAKTIIEIGGQDTKGITIKGGRVLDFVMNDKCAAGTGRFLEIIADSLGVPLTQLGELSLRAKRAVPISDTCTVFAEHEVINQLANGEPIENLIAGIHEATATRICALVRKMRVDKDIAVTGGGGKNLGLVRALEAKLDSTVLVPSEPLMTGALGAALIGQEIYEKATRLGRRPSRSSQTLREATFSS